MALSKVNQNGNEIADAEIRVAERLKQIRQEKRMVLAELAGAAGFSPGYLSRVENHKISLTIASLERLANVLGVPIYAFFEDESERVLMSLCRSGEGRKARFGAPRNLRYEILVKEMKGKLMEPIIVDIGSVAAPPPKSHAGEEFNYVLEGECTFTYGKSTVPFKKGDSVYFDATVPHCCSKVVGKKCKVLAVIGSRDYLFHGDLTRLMSEDAK